MIDEKKRKEKQYIVELDKLNIEKDRILSEIKEQEDKINEAWERIKKPFPDKYASNRLVIINPHLKGYECFYTKGKPLEEYTTKDYVHLWVWKKHNGRDPRPGYHIHHKDKNKLNNSPDNLEELSEAEHFKKHRS